MPVYFSFFLFHARKFFIFIFHACIFEIREGGVVAIKECLGKIRDRLKNIFLSVQKHFFYRLKNIAAFKFFMKIPPLTILYSHFELNS